MFVGLFAAAVAGVLVSLVLMGVSNLSFAGLAMAGHSNLAMAAAIGFENFCSGVGGVAVVARDGPAADPRRGGMALRLAP